MTHPALREIYQYVYQHPIYGPQAWSGWRINSHNLEFALDAIQNSIQEFQQRFPGVTGKLLWYNNGKWEEITLANSKYALFSED